MIYAIIPARKGSKRIKNKNLKKFAGVPIIKRTIDLCNKLKFFDKIIISSDCSKILNLTKKIPNTYQILRSKQLSDDYTSTISVIKNVISKINVEKNSIIFCIYPTSVFLKKKSLVQALKVIQKDENNFVFSAKKYAHPIERSFYKKKKLYFLKKKSISKRSQDLKYFYHDAAQFYGGSTIAWKKKEIINKNSNFIEIPLNESHDIDTIEDWKFAEKLWKIL